MNQDAIDFAKWIVGNKYVLHPYSSKWVFEFDINGRQYEDNELYELYKWDKEFSYF